MSSIDLVILGIVLEKPQSAYDIQNHKKIFLLRIINIVLMIGVNTNGKRN